MTVVAAVDVPTDQFCLGRALAEAGDYYATLAAFVPTRDQFVPYVWLENGDRSTTGESLGSHLQITPVTTDERRPGPALYEIEWLGSPDGFLSELSERDCYVIQASGTAQGWTFELLTADHSELVAFRSACDDRDIDAEITSVSRSVNRGDDLSDLTGKQREILRRAYSRGYFGIPREVTVTELAEELDISPQAASKRLRRGLETAVGSVLEGV